MPQMGVSVSEGTITKWLKQVGEQIEADETLLEISTDKVDTEVPSPGDRRRHGDPGAGGRDGRRSARVLARIGGEAGALPAAPARTARAASPQPAARAPAPRRAERAG